MLNVSQARFAPRAFTLSELIATLIVMLALSTVILPTANGVNSEQNSENTRDVLQAIYDATMGKKDFKTGKTTGGYVQHMGGLPRKQGSDPAHFLSALTVKPANVLAFGPKICSSKDTDLILYTGWNGPYYRGIASMPVFPGEPILDGWGNPITCTFGQYNAITSIQSPGGSEEPYNVPYPTDPIQFNYSQQQTTVSGYVTFNNLNGNPLITVKIFYPNPETGGVQMKYISGHPGCDDQLDFSFSNVPHGFWPVRARVGTVNSGSANKDTEWVDVGAGGVSGLHLHINAGGCN